MTDDEAKRAFQEAAKQLSALLEKLARANIDHTASIEQLRSDVVEIRAFIAETADWYFDAFAKMSARIDNLEVAQYSAAEPPSRPRAN